MDDIIIKHYSNEDTFTVDLEKIDGKTKVTFTEIWRKIPMILLYTFHVLFAQVSRCSAFGGFFNFFVFKKTSENT